MIPIFYGKTPTDPTCIKEGNRRAGHLSNYQAAEALVGTIKLIENTGNGSIVPSEPRS